MTWLILILALAVIIGPVMYLRPSAKDKRLTALRLAARQKGLIIKITRVAKLDASADERVSAGGVRKDPHVNCAAYQLAIGQNLDAIARSHELLLMAIPAAPTQHFETFVPGWARGGSAPHEVWAQFEKLGLLQFLQSQLPQLPPDVLAVGVDGRFVSCYWREQASVEQPVLDDIAAFLAAFKRWMRANFSAPEGAPETD